MAHTLGRTSPSCYQPVTIRKATYNRGGAGAGEDQNGGSPVRPAFKLGSGVS